MILTVHVKPNSRENKIEAVLDETTVKISVKAPATEGKANAELIRFLADELGVAKSYIEIIRGKGTRLKHIEIDGIAQKEAFDLFLKP